MSSHQASNHDAIGYVMSEEEFLQGNHFNGSMERELSYPHQEEALKSLFADSPDLVCFSHLRWDFVYQRPQHLLSRCAKDRRVFFVEEPIFEFTDSWRLDIKERECGVWTVVPYLPDLINEEFAVVVQQSLMTELFAQYAISDPILWYYTPMALPFTSHISGRAIVYDCMDELSAFKGASPVLRDLELQLFERADVVFTGGHSLYEVKRHQHPNVHAFPSSIEAEHFAQARKIDQDPADQACISHPRIGFYGVIDERMDLELLDGMAQARPDWNFMIIGPVVKIDPDTLPRHPNLHYLGGKSYVELPHYLAGWDVAMLPFACNESTRFISPTKTPEYLAAGKPVVSTSIRDVVNPYGEQGYVQIADTVEEFVAAIDHCLTVIKQDQNWQQRVDSFLSQNSWDKTWNQMHSQIEAVMKKAEFEQIANQYSALNSSEVSILDRISRRQ